MDSIKRSVYEEANLNKLSSNQNDYIYEIIEHANRANKLTKKMPNFHIDYDVVNFLQQIFEK